MPFRLFGKPVKSHTNFQSKFSRTNFGRTIIMPATTLDMSASPRDVVVPEHEGSHDVEVAELSALEGVAQHVVVEVDQQQRVHDGPRLST